jgi:hypothetical protein
MLARFLALALLAVPGLALAHHGFTGRYDTDQPIWLVGRVTAVNAAPPHPVITLVPEPSATAPPVGADRPKELTGEIAFAGEFVGRPVQVEFPPVQSFFALGDAVKPGDTVRIIALRNCRPPHQLRSQWVMLPDRRVIQREGRLSYMARGCQ